MNPLQQLYNQLLAGGYPPEQIPDIIRKLSAAQQAGMFQNLNIGTAEQDRADKLAEQARLAQEFRVQTGLGALGLMQTDEQQRAAREGDPFRFVEFLRGVSELPQGAAGNPVSSLVGQGFSIKPQLPTDPHYQSLLDDIAAFGKPRGAASGAKVAMSEPGALVGQSGKVYTTLNENGPEKLSVKPQPGVSRRLDPTRQQQILDRVMGSVPPQYRAAPIPSSGLQFAPSTPPNDTGIPMPQKPVRDTLRGQGPGDLNGDGVINVGDQAISSHRTYLQQGIGNAFNAQRGQPNYNPAFDLNNDGILNSLDLFAAARWKPSPRRVLKSSPATPPNDTGIPGMADGGDTAAAWKAAYAAFHPAGQSQQERDAIDAINWNPGNSPMQDPSFGPSTDTQGARPGGNAAYNIRPDGSVQIVANPVYGGALQPGQNYKNVVGPDGVGHWIPISDAEATQLAIRAHADAVNYWSTGTRAGGAPFAETLADAGGRNGALFGPNANLISNKPQLTYRAATPGGVNAPQLSGSGPFASTPGPHHYDVYGNDLSGNNGPRVRTFTPSDEAYLAANPNVVRYRPAGMASGGYAMPGFPIDPTTGYPKGYTPGSTSDPPSSSGGATGGSITPAQAAAMAMGKALANNPFAPTELVRDLQAGKAANPAYLNQRLRANLDPNLWQGLLSTNQGFGFRPDSVLASAQQYDIPTFNTYYKRF